MSSYKQAQESILGAILVDSKNVMPLVADKLTAENFINPECERVFAACLSLFQEQKHIDVITVLDRLRDESYQAYLVQLVESMIDCGSSMSNLFRLDIGPLLRNLVCRGCPA